MIALGLELGDDAERSLLLDVPLGLNAGQRVARAGLNGHEQEYGHLGGTSASSSSPPTLTNTGPNITSSGPPPSTATTAGIKSIIPSLLLSAYPSQS